MSAKKTNDAVAIADLHEKIDALQAENAALVLENGNLRDETDRHIRECIRFEDRYAEEHQKRMRERGDFALINARLIDRVNRLDTQLKAAKELRTVEKSKRNGSVPKLLIASAVALLLIAVPCTLQKLSIIGPQLSYAIECGLMMVIAWCYALIWDRSKKN